MDWTQDHIRELMVQAGAASAGQLALLLKLGETTVQSWLRPNRPRKPTAYRSVTALDRLAKRVKM